MASIVTAEDDADIRHMILRLLTGAGHDVVDTGDGREAFKYVTELRPDLVVTDGDMPHLTGFDLCRQIKTTPALSHISTLMVSGSLPAPGTSPGLAFVDKCVPKPFKPRGLLEAVNTLLT